MSTPDIVILASAVMLLATVGLCVNQYLVNRSQRRSQAYRHIGQLRRQNQYPADQFARYPKSDLLCSFLHGYLSVPETVIGLGSQSQLTLTDLSRLATLWAALGDDARLCYGFVDERKRHPFRALPSGYATIWVEFRCDGEPWVYWYRDKAATVESRREFYRRGAATLLHDVEFSKLGCYLFKD